MKSLRVLFLAVVCVLAAPAATIVNFDDLPDLPFGPAVPDGYGGLNWAPDFGVWASGGGMYPAHSPENVLLGNRLNGSGYAAMSMVFVTPGAEFLGAWFAGGGTAVFEMYSSGSLVATSATLSLSGTSTFLSSGYAGPVDEVRLTAGRGSFVMDDVTYNPAGVAEVPEPGTIALLGLGLGAGWLLRRRQA